MPFIYLVELEMEWEEEEENLTEKEARRLYEILKEKGHTEEEANEIIAYTVGAKGTKEIGSQTPDK